jgi:hypothetical protein
MARYSPHWRGHLPHLSSSRATLPSPCVLHKLKQHLASDLNPAIVAHDVSLDLDDVAEYPIKEILESRVWGRFKIPQYRIRWDLPYGPESDLWDAAEHLEGCEAVDTFLAKNTTWETKNYFYIDGVLQGYLSPLHSLDPFSSQWLTNRE